MACAFQSFSDTVGICACGHSFELCFAHISSTLCLMPNYQQALLSTGCWVEPDACHCVGSICTVCCFLVLCRCVSVGCQPTNAKLSRA